MTERPEPSVTYSDLDSLIARLNTMATWVSAEADGITELDHGLQCAAHLPQVPREADGCGDVRAVGIVPGAPIGGATDDVLFFMQNVVPRARTLLIRKEVGATAAAQGGRCCDNGDATG